MAISKPPSVQADEYKSAKWDELTRGRAFSPADAPALALLCQWHKVADLASEELESLGGQTAYTTDGGELRAFPQLATLKAASSEIRALTKQLGLTGAGEVEEDGRDQDDDVLTLVLGNRSARRAGAAAQG